MTQNNERGIALVLALFLMSTLSVLAASLMFLAQSETYASMNYRMMSQARYGAEAAVQKAANFLISQYAHPTTGGADNLANYNRTVSPVLCLTGCTAGQPIVLSVSTGVASNYPVAAVVTSFDTQAKGTLMAGNSSITYSAYARLLSMQEFDAYGGGKEVVQTWEITGKATMVGARNANTEVVAILETPKVPAMAYAAFATAQGCGAMYFHGNVTINSYDSASGFAPGQTQPTYANYGGNVGTNGNLQIAGSVDVKGNLSTPRTGVGACTDGAVTALSETGSATVEGSTVKLPKAVLYPAPTFTTVPPTNVVTVDAALFGVPATACASIGTVPDGLGGQTPLIVGVNCFVDAASKTITINGNGAEVTMPSVSVASTYTVKFKGHEAPSAIVNINSLAGTGSIEIDANSSGPGTTNEAVVMKVMGKNPDGTDMTRPFDLEAMGWKQTGNVSNNATKFDATAFQLLYGGTGEIYMDGGNGQSAASIYAPNATFTLKGTQDLYGSVIAKTVENEGNANIHYDRRLGRDFWVPGQPMAGAFSWKRY